MVGVPGTIGPNNGLSCHVLLSRIVGMTNTTRTYQLRQELEAAQESPETTIEELQSANEEVETTNEEQQSTNEELEITNEELRATNEELEATNEVLRHQSDEATAYRLYTDAILRSTNAAMIVLDREQKVRSWNRSSESVWGLRSEEAIDRIFADLDIGLPIHQLAAPVQGVIDSGKPADLEINAVERRGRPIHCRVRITPLLYNDRESHGAVVIVEEIKGTGQTKVGCQ
jgi:two-component system CheB/CheR fusion protein